MNTSILLPSLVAVLGAAAEFVSASRISEHMQLVLVGVTLLVVSSLLRNRLRLRRRSETA